LIFVHLLNVALVGQYLQFCDLGNGMIVLNFCFLIALVQILGSLGPYDQCACDSVNYYGI